MKGLIRIRAKGQVFNRDPDETGRPTINGICPSWPDVYVSVVASDGSETPLTGVKSVQFKAQESSEPLTAIIECYVDELDVEAEAELPSGEEMIR